MFTVKILLEITEWKKDIIIKQNGKIVWKSKKGLLVPDNLKNTQVISYEKTEKLLNIEIR
jgi:hypothetical protein